MREGHNRCSNSVPAVRKLACRLENRPGQFIFTTGSMNESSLRMGTTGERCAPCRDPGWMSVWLLILLLVPSALRSAVVFETVSPHHRIRVVDQGGLRILSFDGSQETRMSLANPLEGHFEYIEFFHLPWIWNAEIERVAMIGLGGGSIQRAYQHYYPGVHIDSVDIDPEVVQIAKRFFHVRESPTHRIHIRDGREFLRVTQDNYDVILVDAYSSGPQGPAVPRQLVTKEFFEITYERLGPNGVLMFNVIGSLAGARADMIGALHNTLKTVFPQVYLFPARESINVVFLATKSPMAYDARQVLSEAQARVRHGTVRIPTFTQRAQSFVARPPPAAAFSPVLTDHYVQTRGLGGMLKQSLPSTPVTSSTNEPSIP
jgi:spermidine synthase